MNARKAKKIRKMVYGDGSKRNENKYIFSGPSRYKKYGTIRAVGKRATYLKAKKEAQR